MENNKWVIRKDRTNYVCLACVEMAKGRLTNVDTRGSPSPSQPIPMDETAPIDGNLIVSSIL